MTALLRLAGFTAVLAPMLGVGNLQARRSIPARPLPRRTLLPEGDLAYLHVHPDEEALSFATEVPTPGRYRLLLDVKVDGPVQTTVFMVEGSR